MEATSLLQRAQSRFERDPGFRAAGFVPGASALTRAVDDLLTSGLDAAAADLDLENVARAYEVKLPPGTPLSTGLLRVLALTQAPLSDAATHLQAAAARLGPDLDGPVFGPLWREVQAALDEVHRVQPDVAAASALAQLLPSAIGAKGARRYLIALPNPAELRPDGGYSGFLGVVHFDQGHASGLVVEADQNLSPMHPCYPVPKVLSYYLTFVGGCFDLGDAGWEPDFPATASLMEQMYAASTGAQVDGVIALDPYAVASVLGVVGPLSVPGYGSFDAGNVFDRLDVIVNAERNLGVMSSVASALLNKVFSGPLSQWPRLVSALRTAAAGRHIQVHVRDAALEANLLQGPVGGAVLGGAGDYLMVVDANLSPNKADVEITKGCVLQSTLDASGVVTHEVDATYDYPLAATPSKLDTILNGDGNYRDYVRFFVPSSASLTDIRFLIDGKPAAAATQPLEQLGDRTAIGVFFVLPRGHTAEVRVTYSDRVQADSGNSYLLTVQKQPGVDGRPTEVDLTYPAGQQTWRSNLAQDARFAVSW